MHSIVTAEGCPNRCMIPNGYPPNAMYATFTIVDQDLIIGDLAATELTQVARPLLPSIIACISDHISDKWFMYPDPPPRARVLMRGSGTDVLTLTA